MEISIKHPILTSEGEKCLEVDATIDEGSFIGVFGKSGIGKTTFFKILAGIIQPDFGRISTSQTLLDTQQNLSLPPQKRDISLMFQDYALFPNMTVKENIAFAQKVKDKPFTDELLQRFELSPLQNRYPYQLSGGQQQRVALARTLAQKAKIMLLDEPLSAVDRQMRTVMIDTIFEHYKTYEPTVFIISHDPSEFEKLISGSIQI